MLILSQNKKIAFIALSLFIVSLSIVFVLSSSNHSGNEETLQNNVFSSLFAKHAEGEDANAEEDKGPVLTITKAGEFISFNNSFSEQFGHNTEDLKNQKFFSLFHPEDLANFIGSFTKAVQNKEEIVYSGPYRFKNKNGDYRLVILSMSVKKSSVVLTFKDITDSVEELQESNDGSGGGKSIKNLEDKDDARIVVEKRM